MQSLIEKAVKFLCGLLPERELNESFMAIIRDGTGKEFDVAHNREWLKHTRPILEAFSHARYMVEMAVRYAELPEPPQPMPSGWAGLLYLYDLRWLMAVAKVAEKERGCPHPRERCWGFSDNSRM